MFNPNVTFVLCTSGNVSFEFAVNLKKATWRDLARIAKGTSMLDSETL